ARYGALMAPWGVAPGLAPGTFRTVPYSPTAAGIMARTAAGVAAAGVNGMSRAMLDVRATFTDQEREDLNASGVDVARYMFGTVRTYGYRTLASKTTPAWRELT